MNQRKLELEEKRARLAAIREEKRLRNLHSKRDPAHDASSTAKSGQTGSLSRCDETFIEEVLQEISKARLGGLSGIDTPRSSSGTSTPGELSLQQNVNQTKCLSSPNSQYFTARTPTKNLSLSQVSQLSILPKDFVCYTKQTQTPSGSQGLAKDAKPLHLYEGPFVFHTFEWEDEFHPKESDDDEGEEDEEDYDGAGPQTRPKAQMPVPSRVRPKGDRSESPSLVEAANAGTSETPSGSMSSSSFGRTLLKELTENEKRVIEKSDDFVSFLHNSSKVMERALKTERSDIFIDYVGASEELKGFEDDDDGAEAILKNADLFFHDRWSRHRVVTSLQWSQHHNELLLATYGSHEDSPLEPDGVALVWNARFMSANSEKSSAEPEFIFHCQSGVMSASFSPFHQNLVIGGTYSGQIVLWDNRVPRRTPVQRTPLSASGGHTHPVYCLGVMGSTHAHSLISISTDGKMCSWAMDMLTQPVETMELTQVHSPHRPLAATCMSFFKHQLTNEKEDTFNHRSFFVGSEEGTVFVVDRHGSGSLGKGASPENFFSHYGPVTGISCHPSRDYGNLILTSSFDRTVKLWRSSHAPSSSSPELTCLNSFEDFSDYVLDVAWSPGVASMFAAVDAGGVLSLWDVSSDLQLPFASVRPDPAVALNRLAWSTFGGGREQILAAGDDFGRVWLYDIKGVECDRDGGEQQSKRRRKLHLALEEMRENMQDMEARIKANEELKKW